MTALKYWDTGSSTWKTLSGPPGPTVVSADANNLARLGSDNYLYTPATNVGRNLLHNSMFRVQQRGTGGWVLTTAPTYGADRWWGACNLDSSSMSVQPHTDASRLQINDESAQSLIQCLVTGNAGAASYSYISQPIENVRRLANKTVTISFWASINLANLKIGVSLDQSFGTGGSPSAVVYLNNAGTVTAPDTAWHRYSIATTLPSSAGKTLGTNGDDATNVNFWVSSGTTQNGRAGTGVQTGTFQFWGIQLEIGSVMTPLEKIDIQQDLAKCQRFYIAGNAYGTGYAAAAGGFLSWSWQLPVTMRALPTVTPNFTTNTNVTSATIGALGAGVTDAVRCGGTATAIGNWTLIGTFTASADL